MSIISDSNGTYGNDESAVSDIVNLGTGVEGSLTATTSAVEVKVGGSRLTSRKLVTLHNNSSNTIYWGWTSGVTTSTGTPIYKNQMIQWSVGDSQTIYVIAASVGNNTRVTEA